MVPPMGLEPIVDGGVIGGKWVELNALPLQEQIYGLLPGPPSLMTLPVFIGSRGRLRPYYL